MPMRPDPAAMMRWSQAHANIAPPAIAWPFTAAMTGRGNSNTERNAAVRLGTLAITYSRSSARTLNRSAPAEKHLPSPVRTTAPASDDSSSSNPSLISRRNSASRALTGGFEKVASAISPRRSSFSTGLAVAVGQDRLPFRMPFPQPLLFLTAELGQRGFVRPQLATHRLPVLLGLEASEQ